MTGEDRRLNVKTLGQDVVLLGGQPVHWPSRATRDLFAVLLLSPRGLTKFDLIEKLWGDALSEANGNFKVTLHRLRQALEDKGAIVEHAGRYALSEAYLGGADHVQFQAALARAHATTDRDERLKWLSGAIELYGGDYLPDQQNDWAEEIRIMLRTSYVHARLELARMHCGAVECHSAIRHLATGLASDPLVGEHHHQALMTCLCTLGRSDDAISHYRHYRSFLQREIGDTPTGDTVRLADQIRNAQVHVARQIGGPSDCPRRVLYGDLPVVAASWQPPDLGALARELGRGHRMLDLLTGLEEASGWVEVVDTAERLITATLPGISAALLSRQDLDLPLDLQARLAPSWPGELLRALIGTLTGAGAAERGVPLGVQRVEGVELHIQVIGDQREVPDVWLGAARIVGGSGFTSEDRELLARMGQAVGRTLSRTAPPEHGPESGKTLVK